MTLRDAMLYYWLPLLLRYVTFHDDEAPSSVHIADITLHMMLIIAATLHDIDTPLRLDIHAAMILLILHHCWCLAAAMPCHWYAAMPLLLRYGYIDTPLIIILRRYWYATPRFRIHAIQRYTLFIQAAAMATPAAIHYTLHITPYATYAMPLRPALRHYRWRDIITCCHWFETVHYATLRWHIRYAIDTLRRYCYVIIAAITILLRYAMLYIAIYAIIMLHTPATYYAIITPLILLLPAIIIAISAYTLALLLLHAPWYVICWQRI